MSGFRSRRRLVFDLLRILRAFGARKGANHDVEVAVAKEFGRRIRLAVKSGILDELVHDLEPDLLVGLLTAAEAQFDANLHVVTKKLNRVVQLGFQIMRVDGRRDLNLFHLASRSTGISAGFLFAFGFLVEELAVVNDAADGRGGVWSDLNEVEALGLGEPECVREGHHTELLFFVVDNPDFASADFAIPAMERFARAKRTGRERAAQ